MAALPTKNVVLSPGRGWDLGITPSQDRIRALEQGFRLGAWQILPHASCIERAQPISGSAAARTHIAAKAMRVLVQLAATPDEFVSKDQLMATVWSGRVVTDDVLTGAVRALRRAMEDNAREPHIIETRKGAGYRLVAAVKLGSRAPVRSGRKLLPWVASLAFASLAGALLWRGAVLDAPPTIAVLPFDGISDTGRDESLAAAMTDGLITKLAEHERLRVISRTSVVRYDGRQKSLPTIARELGADFLVEGSVLAGDVDVRISAQLIDARSDTHLWVASYDRPFDDILDIQDEVVARIAQDVIGAVAAPATEAIASLTGPALQALLSARYLLAQAQPEPVEKALTIFEKLAGEHPTVAGPHLGKAQAQLFLFKKYYRPHELLDEAAAAAARAIELDPRNAEGHRCLGQIVFFKDWDFARSEQLYRDAIALNPSDTIARQRYAWLLVSLRRYDDALEQIAAIRLLDPHYYASADGAMLLLFSGEFQAAVKELQRIEETAPGSQRVQRILSLAYWGLGNHDASTQALIASREAAGDPQPERDRLRAVFAAEGRAGVYRTLIAADVFRSPVSKAGLYAQLGDDEAALKWLNLAIAGRDPQVLFVQSRPEFFAMHTDPRFRALVRRINQPH